MWKPSEEMDRKLKELFIKNESILEEMNENNKRSL